MSHVNKVKVEDTVTVATATIACDGSMAVGGHPRVYLNVAQRGQAWCPYCSKHFVLDRTAKLDHGH